MNIQERDLPNGRELAEALSQTIIETKLLGYLGNYFTVNLLRETDHAESDTDRQEIITNQAIHFQTWFESISHGKIPLKTAATVTDRQVEHYTAELTILVNNPEAFKQALAVEEQRARWKHSSTVIQRAIGLTTFT